MALPEDTPERAKKWAEVEVEREKRETFVGRLQAVGKDPGAALKALE